MSQLFMQLRRLAERESARFQHYYLGVEHLFLALLQISEGETVNLLRAQGASPEFLRFCLEQEMPPLSGRFWEGYRQTPRYERVIALAEEYGKHHPLGERDILLAILAEADSLPIRVLQDNGVNLPVLHQMAQTGLPNKPVVDEEAPFTSTLPLMKAEIDLLRHMLSQGKLEVQSELLTDENDSARYYVVTQQQATWLCKIDHPQSILQEKRRYESLPPDLPLLPEMLGVQVGETLGLLARPLNMPPQTALHKLSELSASEASGWLTGTLVPLLKKAWQFNSGIYHFPLWRELEVSLPSALVVGPVPPASPLQGFGENNSATPLHPMQAWTFDPQLPTGTLVNLRDFTVRQVSVPRREVILGAGRGDEAVHASAQVRLVDVPPTLLEGVQVGRSWRSFQGLVQTTRPLLLTALFAEVGLNFEASAETWVHPLGTFPHLPNLLAQVLAQEVESALCPQNGSAWLTNCLWHADRPQWADFSRARLGHFALDMAFVEVSLCSQYATLYLPDTMTGYATLLETLSALWAGQEQEGPFMAVLSAWRRSLDLSSLGVERLREYAGVVLCAALETAQGRRRPMTIRRFALLTALSAARAYQTL